MNMKKKKENEKSKSFTRLRAAANNSISNQIFDLYSEEDEERDTNFVVTALKDSRESMKMLVCIFVENKWKYINNYKIVIYCVYSVHCTSCTVYSLHCTLYIYKIF